MCVIFKTVVRAYVNQSTFKPVLACNFSLVFAFLLKEYLLFLCSNSVFHPASYPMVPAGLLLGSKADAAWKWSFSAAPLVFNGNKVWKAWSFVYTPCINLKIAVLRILHCTSQSWIVSPALVYITPFYKTCIAWLWLSLKSIRFAVGSV
jgi:hypothetical protein